MKISNVIIFLILLAIGISAFYVVENDKKDVFAFHPRGVYEGQGHLENFERDKADARNKILLIGSGVVVLLLILYFSIVKQENKADPLKNLESLKNNSIITHDEYKIKISEAKNLKQKENTDKEIKKIRSELENLKTKGIISESEYIEKVKVIQDKFNSSIK